MCEKSSSSPESHYIFKFKAQGAKEKLKLKGLGQFQIEAFSQGNPFGLVVAAAAELKKLEPTCQEKFKFSRQ